MKKDLKEKHMKGKMEGVTLVADWAPNCTNPLGLCFYERIRLVPGE